MSELFDFFADEKLRFCMVDSEQMQRSSDWVVWANKGSLYFSVVVLGGVLKFSMHPRGTSRDGKDCQFGATSRLWNRIRDLNYADKVPFHRWKQPDSSKNQISLVASIFFPTEALRTQGEPRRLSRRKAGLLLPEPGKAAEIGIFSHYIDVDEKPNLDKVERSLLNEGYLPLVDFDLAGERATVAVRSVDFPFNANEIVPANPEEFVFLGNPLQVGQTVIGAHSIAILGWPSEGQPLILAEVNGFSFHLNAE